MEQVLDVYRRPFDPAFPVVCMDETPRQLISETREPTPAEPGRPARHDYEYRRCGTCNVFMAAEPLAGKRMTKVTLKAQIRPAHSPFLVASILTFRCICIYAELSLKLC